MTVVDFFYSTISLGDAAILFAWGFIDFRAGHRRDAFFLMAIGLCSLTAYGLGQDKNALETLRTSHYLPAIAATTTVLRRLHNKAAPFMDKIGRSQGFPVTVDNVLHVR